MIRDQGKCNRSTIQGVGLSLNGGLDCRAEDVGPAFQGEWSRFSSDSVNGID